MLKYEVQRIDGSSISIRQAVDLIIKELTLNHTISYIVEQSFINEYMKCILNWIGMGDTLNIKETFNSINEVLRSDSELISGEETSSKKRFGLQLHTLNQMLEVYLHTDLESKSYLKLMNLDKKNLRIRTLFHLLFEKGRSVSLNELEFFSLYKENDISKKTIERDLDELIELKLLRKLFISDRKIIYELTPNAFYWKDKIEKPVIQTENINKSFTKTIIVTRPHGQERSIQYNSKKRSVYRPGEQTKSSNNLAASKSNKYSSKHREVKNPTNKNRSEMDDLFKVK